jgi:hypothetical protein
MSARIQVPANEHGVVRVFQVDLPEHEIARFTNRNGTWPLREALGAEHLDPDHVEVFPVSDLEGVGLPGYLEEGLGIPAEELDDMRGRLEALSGPVMVVTSRAFGGTDQALSPRHPLRHVATFHERRKPVSFGPLPSESARGSVATAPSEDTRAARGARRAAIVALAGLLLAGLLLVVILA